MDAEALGVSYSKSIANGSGLVGAVKMYSDLRCKVSGKVVLANRNMGTTAVLREVEKKCDGMSRNDKEQWIEKNGKEFFTKLISECRKSMPKSVSCAEPT